MQDNEFSEIFFKSLSSDGQKVSIEDMKKALRDLKMRDQGATPEEYIERTVGKEKAKAFYLD
eukprot:CAMPEP_0170550150 /NCGR_PEP_ID=MMETSP0211-20121228/8210_1 /TAXON_ID=311385 /ORGANISM="Pseudokeronopsis sp., Strain OXSARD2" /LENGTH=61 /DNA_ID=CAMNT_0010856513 /DNA_START=271 /DNA_END=456 /DNA_ORIENTATION=+